MEDNLRVSITEVAEAMGMDAHTVRVLIQQGVFTWARCFKKPGNHQYTYLILRKDFEQATGYKTNSTK